VDLAAVPYYGPAKIRLMLYISAPSVRDILFVEEMCQVR